MNNRVITTRNAEINKNTVLKISNRTGNKVDLGYGETEYEYGEIQELDVFAKPINNVYEASAYGVSITGGLKLSLTMQETLLFNEFTRIWINTTPSSDKDNPEYYVSSNQPVLTTGTVVIDKVDGNE